jgi:hypothetical protein
MCMYGLVCRWPVWGNNVGDFFISSLAPLHLMQAEGLVDKNIKFVPVTDGRHIPLFYHLWLAPLTWHKVGNCVFYVLVRALFKGTHMVYVHLYIYATICP